jgi:cytochrome c553
MTISSKTELRLASWLLGAGLAAAAAPLAGHGASIALREFDMVLASKPDPAHGEMLFKSCAGCHGQDGGGVPDGSVPAIAGQHFQVIARELVDYRHDKRWDLRMQFFTDEHHLKSVQDIADLASFVGELPRSWKAGTGTGQYVPHGAEVYAHLCASCHGARGEGSDGQRVPRVAGQHFEYLLRQMHDAVEGRRPNFPPDHIRLLQPFERADLVGVADFLSRTVP